MFKIGDRVKHKTTGIAGRVIGYGTRLIDNSSYSTTIKVELLSSGSCGSIKPIAEDLGDRWQVQQDKKILACSLPYPKNPIFN